VKALQQNYKLTIEEVY